MATLVSLLFTNMIPIDCKITIFPDACVDKKPYYTDINVTVAIVITSVLFYVSKNYIHNSPPCFL